MVVFGLNQWLHFAASGGILVAVPTVSLRLTDSELALLREWAFGSRRSLQREIVFRLFDGAVTERGEGRVVAESSRTGVDVDRSVGEGHSRTPAERSSRSVTAPSVQPVVHDVRMDASPVDKVGCGFDTPRGTKCKLCGKVH